MRGENIPWELAAGWEEGEGGKWISSLRQVERVVNEAVANNQQCLEWQSCEGREQKTLSSQTCLGERCWVHWGSLGCHWSLWLVSDLWGVLHQPSSRANDVIPFRSNLLSKCLVHILWVSWSCIHIILLQLTVSCHPLFLRTRDLHSTWPCEIFRNKYQICAPQHDSLSNTDCSHRGKC